jgi:hypothetical protein
MVSRRPRARIDAQVGRAVTTAHLPTARYDLDETHTLTLTLAGRSDDPAPGTFWYLLLVADLTEEGPQVGAIRQCVYLTGSDRGSVMFSSPDVQVTLEITDSLVRRRLKGTIEGRLRRVASLASAPEGPAALLKATFTATADSAGTFQLVEDHDALIRRLRRRHIQLEGQR